MACHGTTCVRIQMGHDMTGARGGRKMPPEGGGTQTPSVPSPSALGTFTRTLAKPATRPSSDSGVERGGAGGGGGMGGCHQSLNEYAASYFRVYARARLLRRESSKLGSRGGGGGAQEPEIIMLRYVARDPGNSVEALVVLRPAQRALSLPSPGRCAPFVHFPIALLTGCRPMDHTCMHGAVPGTSDLDGLSLAQTLPRLSLLCPPPPPTEQVQHSLLLLMPETSDVVVVGHPL